MAATTTGKGKPPCAAVDALERRSAFCPARDLKRVPAAPPRGGAGLFYRHRSGRGCDAGGLTDSISIPGSIFRAHGDRPRQLPARWRTNPYKTEKAFRSV